MKKKASLARFSYLFFFFYIHSFSLQTLLTVRDIDSSVIVMKKMDFQKKNKLMNVLHKIWNDLWKDSIDIETFMTFFIEIQSHMIQLVDDANIR